MARYRFLSVTSVSILRVLEEHPRGLRGCVVARRVGVRGQDLSRWLSSLRVCGYAARENGHWYITEEGAEILADYRVAVGQRVMTTRPAAVAPTRRPAYSFPA